MNYMQVATLLTFLTIILIILGFTAGRKSKKKKIDDRLEKYTSMHFFTPEEERAEAVPENSLRTIFKNFSMVLAPKGWIKKAELELAQADIPLRPEEFVTLRIISVVFITLIMHLLFENFLLTVAAALVSALVPPMMVKRAKVQRIVKFNYQLAEGLTIMANSLRAGFSFMQAMDTLSKEMPPPLSTEFTRVLQEINLGTTTEEALSNMLKRVDSEDLDLVLTAVIIQRQIGGNLAEILDKIGGTIQQRIKLKGELKTLTAQGRISGLIIGLLPLFLIAAVAVINQDYIMTLFQHPLGLFMLAWAVCSEIIGFLLIRKIVSIEF